MHLKGSSVSRKYHSMSSPMWPDRGDADSLAGELGFHPVRFLTGVEHHRDRGDALPFLVQELLPGIARAQRLDQLEVEIADHRLGPAHVELAPACPSTRSRA